MAANLPHTQLLRDAIRAFGLPEHTRILIAVSGGADSVALLAAFDAVASAEMPGWLLRVAHVNHAIRGAESDGDEAFVRELAAKLGREIEVICLEPGPTDEAAMRDARYQALEVMRGSWPADVIALGHTRNDQAETFLLHLLRGSGLSGLSGMPGRRGSLVRPFLDIDRPTIEKALAEQNLPFREDRSNLDTRYRRNRLRHETLPALELIQPGIVDILAREARLFSLDASYMQQEVQRAGELLDVAETPAGIGAALPAFLALHSALQRHVLRTLLERIIGDVHDIHQSHLEAMLATLESGNQGVHLAGQLPHTLEIDISPGRFALRRAQPHAPSPPFEAYLSIPGIVTLPAGVISAEPVEGERDDIERELVVAGPFVAYLRAGALEPPLLVRNRKPGDRVRSRGAPGSRKIQDLMVDRHVPAHRRDVIPVALSGGTIVWIPGLAIDARAAAVDASEPLIRLSFQPKNDLLTW
ncbi:MAG: tRNA lysidine(34) synthetase TilS [Chloroflexota bacterium]